MTSLIVELPQGKLQGKENKSVLNGEPYYSFLGIPYAKPPIGDLRFKAPQPSEKWQGIYDATYDRDWCIQRDIFSTQDSKDRQGILDNTDFRKQNFSFSSQNLKGSEDCLFLGVDLPQIPSKINVPKAVMVFIHGGAFYGGSGSQDFFSSDYLMAQDVIVVRIQYRLHVLGFLNLGLPDCPGNVGLKDQTFALKWVKENISYFGGDPNNITIFGISTGGSSVNFHLLSPLSKGLFNKAIVQCGTAFSPWSLTFDNKNMAKKLGEKCGFGGGSDSDLLDFLKKQTAEDLARNFNEIMNDIKKKNPGLLNLSNPFSPSVEEIKENAFLPELPHKLLETADPVPLIYGLNEMEGTMGCFVDTDQVWETLKNDFTVLLKDNFQIDPSKLAEVSAKVKHYYFGEKTIGPDTTNQLVDLYSDLYFYHLYEPIEFAIKSRIPPFVYKFTYQGGLNLSKSIISENLKLRDAACHGDESCYLFHVPIFVQNPALVGDDLTMIRNMTKFWTDFAKTGLPTDESIWVPSTLDQPKYLKIDRSLQLVKGKLYGERWQFLRDTLNPVIEPRKVGDSEEYFPYYKTPEY